MAVSTFAPTEVHTYGVVVLGAGPAGMCAAIHSAQALSNTGNKVALVEHKERPGNKLTATGGGACNITNALNIRLYPPNYPRVGKSIAPLLSRYSNQQVMDYFLGRGIALEVEPSGKVFPRSRKATEVRDVLVSHCLELKVNLLLNASTASLIRGEDGTWGVALADGRLLLTSALIIATGGVTYPSTGSNGSIWELLNQATAGTISRPALRSALNPLLVEGYDCTSIEGVSFQEVELHITPCGAKRKRFGMGDILCTKNGFSGPLALNASTIAEAGDVITWNFLPSHSSESLFEVLWLLLKTTRRTTANAFIEHMSLPSRFVELSISQANLDSVPAQVSKKSLRRFCDLICTRAYSILPETLSQNGMVTAGGIALDKLDKNTLEAKQFPALYFAGEVIDVHGYTGGFNLQWAFSSGYVAGFAAASQVLRQGSE